MPIAEVNEVKRSCCLAVVPVDCRLQVKVIARVSGVESDVETCLTVDKSSNDVILHEPGPQLTSSSQRQRSLTTGPRHFMFDQVFGPDDSLVCITQPTLMSAQ